ncbi:hypothetical protein L6452_14078 [Arctium lappa]|uniref:Uncharacterized protein n=1 Tax=Arctium lappa TaxID=4217 RepID=A0ACB9CK36_ARCLA|nr:hypothetical protein L6452_14078 [Arctium lappa]
MMSSSLRFRRKQGFTEMGKPDGHPRKDVTIIPSCGKFSGLSSKPPNGKPELHSDLSFAKGKVVVHDNHNSAKKRKFIKIETDSTNGFRNTCHINFETSSRRKSSNPDVLALSLSPPDTDRKSEPSKLGGSSSPFQQKSDHGSTPDQAELNRGPVLILMSCLNCYLHVMVSDANPKCPNCGKGDCLLDMFRVSPVKKARIV